MKLAFLVPAPDYADEWRWAFDAEAAALVAGGIEVDPVPWTEAGDLASYDLVLPLVVWGYHERPVDWFGFLDRVACEQLPMVNPPALLRWSCARNGWSAPPLAISRSWRISISV